MIVGLTGSIGMGKSSVAHMLRELNVPVQDADRVVHDLYTSPEVVSLVGDRFPDVVRFSVVDRKALGRLVSENPDVLVWLESLVHPRVLLKQAAFLAQQEKAGIDFAVLEIPLLFETQDRDLFDLVVTVSAPGERQRERVLKREGMTPDKFEYLLYRQWSDEKKRVASDSVLENDGTREELDEKSEALALYLLEESGKMERQKAWPKWQAISAARS